MSNEHDTCEPAEAIAIIGMAGRFPGASDLRTFWSNLEQGVESVSFFSEAELLAAGVAPQRVRDPEYVRARGMLCAVDQFAAPFFGYTPREAEMMDPQHRIFLESAWEALEDAGYDGPQWAGAIGVYAGVGVGSYLMQNVAVALDRDAREDMLPMILGNEKDFVVSRVSYKLDCRGPSVTVQAACATSLVAIHMACQSLLARECDAALAGGVTVYAAPVGYWFQEGGYGSPDGHCRSFDASARGTVPSSGAGVVVLKRLSDALADRDHVYAVIKGSAVSNDGAAKVGFTAPGLDGQARAITEALAVGNVDARTVSYVEAHGTATALGDPIEVAALTKAFRSTTPDRGFCALGSVKTNIGHTDRAAGVAGVIKTALALQHRVLPASLHFVAPNRAIDFASTPFYVNARRAEWPAMETPRRAGVNSLGLGGVNAHLVMEEAPAAVATSPSRRPHQLVVLSARTDAALERVSERLADHLEQHPGTDLADAAYTLALGRRPLERRRAVICRDPKDAAAALRSKDPARVFTRQIGVRPASVGFLFPGGGAQHVGMARGLYETEPVFRAVVDRCAGTLQHALGQDVRTVMYPADGTGAAEDAARLLRSSMPGLPALFVIEYALAQLWSSWGIRPDAMIGHSLGEYVAACLAGVMSLDDALSVVAERSRLLTSLPSGAMMSVALGEDEVRALLLPGVAVAAINGPRACVVSGRPEAVSQFAAHLEKERADVEARVLHMATAGHSEVVLPILPEFERFMRGVTLHAPSIPYLSNVTGDWITPELTRDPAYWARHLRQTVRFAEGMARMLDDQDRTVFLEVGPGRALGSLASQDRARSAGRTFLPSLPAPQEGVGEALTALASLGRLWLAGAPVNWNGFYRSEERARLSLPTYPFERQRYWIEAQQGPSRSGGDAGRHAGTGAREAAPIVAVDDASRAPGVSSPGTADELSSPAGRYPRPDVGTEYVAPRTGVEQAVAEVWSRGLGVDRLGINDNFFELGGQSLLAVQLASELARDFGVPVPVASLLRSPTIAATAKLVEAALVEQIEQMSDDEAESQLGDDDGSDDDG